MGEVGHARAPIQVLRDQRRISELYLKGKPMHEIAEIVGLSRPTVVADLKVIQVQWMTESTTALQEAKARELARLNLLETEYWSGWERSKEDAVVVTEEESDEKGFKRKTQRKGQAGDPRFLDGVNRCVENRCKILGITLDITLNIDLNILPLEYLERIVNGESEIDVFADFQKRERVGAGAIEAAFLPDPIFNALAEELPDSTLTNVKVDTEEDETLTNAGDETLKNVKVDGDEENG